MAAIGLSALGVLLLAADLGDAADLRDVVRWMAAGFAAAIVMTVVVGNLAPSAPHRTNRVLVGAGLVLIALSLASAGLIATLGTPLGIASLAGFLVTLALAILTSSPRGRRYLPAASVVSGLGLVACGAWVYRELGDLGGSAFQPGVLAVVSLVVPGAQTAVAGLLRRQER